MTRLAAHRGGARLWPENSLRAFRESLALGADLVELDVHLTADGALAVIHDATLRRTTDRLRPGRPPTRPRGCRGPPRPPPPPPAGPPPCTPHGAPSVQ